MKTENEAFVVLQLACNCVLHMIIRAINRLADGCSERIWADQSVCYWWSATWSQCCNWTRDVEVACSTLDFTLLASNSRRQTYICWYLFLSITFWTDLATYLNLLTTSMDSRRASVVIMPFTLPERLSINSSVLAAQQISVLVQGVWQS